MNERPEPEEERAETVETKERSVRGTVGEREETEGFLPPQQMERFREQWEEIQTGFVDDPQKAVQKAHGLVSSLTNELNETLTRERGKLESQWNRGEAADTEDLRIALTRYRAFFNRLLR
jgi:hypothetical protein